MNAEFTMIGFERYSDKELELIEQKRRHGLGYKTSNYQPYEQPQPVKDLEGSQNTLQEAVGKKMVANGGNHRAYWEKWHINTGAGAFKNPEEEEAGDVIEGRIGQRQAIIDFMVDLGLNPEKFNNVSLEDLRKMAITAGA